jgi:hypothetical protein
MALNVLKCIQDKLAYSAIYELSKHSHVLIMSFTNSPICVPYHKASQITKLIALAFNFEQNFIGCRITSIHMELFGFGNYITKYHMSIPIMA